MLGPRYNLGSLLDLLPLAYISRCLQLSLLATAQNVVLAAEEYVLRKISSDLLYERKKARLLEHVRGIFHMFVN